MHPFPLILVLTMLGSLGAVELQAGKEYTVSQLNGAPVPKLDGLASPTLTLDAKDSRVSGTSGINRYGGGYLLKDGVLTVSQPPFSTLMAGPEGAMAVERQFLRVISSPLTVAAHPSGIQLSGEHGTLLLIAK